MVELIKQRSAFYFIPAREGALLVGYSPDYVARLAREGKVVAKRVGRSWYVDRDSLKLFTLEVEADKRRRHKELKDKRRQEQLRKHFALRERYLKAEYNRGTVPVVVESIVITLCTLLFAVIGTVAYQERVALGDLVAGASHTTGTIQQAMVFDSLPNWADIFWFIKHEEVKTTTLVKNDISTPVLPASTPMRHIPAQVEHTGTVVVQGSDLAQKFSDTVHMQFFDTRHGTITPQFESGIEQHYPFVIKANNE